MEIGELDKKLTGFQGWIWLILLTAVFLRLHHLTEAPPGLTHDEADHGISAWQVLNGERPIYFTIGYGREPFYDYATAGLMALIGQTYLAGRLTAVFTSLILIAIMYAWVRRTFNQPTALLTAAGLALSFWPQMTGRQMLRSTMLPTLFALAVYFFWQGVRKQEGFTEASAATFTIIIRFARLLITFFSGLLLFYTYTLLASAGIVANASQRYWGFGY